MYNAEFVMCAFMKEFTALRVLTCPELIPQPYLIAGEAL